MFLFFFQSKNLNDDLIFPMNFFVKFSLQKLFFLTQAIDREKGENREKQ